MNILKILGEVLMNILEGILEETLVNIRKNFLEEISYLINIFEDISNDFWNFHLVSFVD